MYTVKDSEQALKKFDTYLTNRLDLLSDGIKDITVRIQEIKTSDITLEDQSNKVSIVLSSKDTILSEMPNLKPQFDIIEYLMAANLTNAPQFTESTDVVFDEYSDFLKNKELTMLKGNKKQLENAEGKFKNILDRSKDYSIQDLLVVLENSGLTDSEIIAVLAKEVFDTCGEKKKAKVETKKDHVLKSHGKLIEEFLEPINKKEKINIYALLDKKGNPMYDFDINGKKVTTINKKHVCDIVSKLKKGQAQMDSILIDQKPKKEYFYVSSGKTKFAVKRINDNQYIIVNIGTASKDNFFESSKDVIEGIKTKKRITELEKEIIDNSMSDSEFKSQEKYLDTLEKAMIKVKKR